MSEKPGLKEKLKQAGLEAAEEQTRLALKHIKRLAKILVEDTINPFDNMAYKGILMLEDELLKVIDKIDGKVDGA